MNRSGSNFLELKCIAKSYGGLPALDDISLTVETGQILCILGPSGCGKSTLLRVMAGIEMPDAGQVLIEGLDMTGVPVENRSVGMVFQDFALFPHKTVAGNIAFGLEMMKLPRGEIDRRVADMLSLVDMADYGNRQIHQLSGGQRQRVALARSLAPQPRLLLLDEPMGSLDRALRERLVQDLGIILRHINMTAVYVTHDHAEGFGIADQIAIMNQGQIGQVGTPEQVYRHPGSAIIARFLGFDNFLDGTLESGGMVKTGVGVFNTCESDHRVGETVKVLIRPDAAVLEMEGQGAPDQNRVSGKLVSRMFQGRNYRIRVRIPNGDELVFDLPNQPAPPGIGGDIHLLIRNSAITVF
ncbi:MAG: ABC transporter ATP-binding protein [Desulfatirhabdiaceae bacterium]